ncbi:MAG: hypothetical protein WCO05_03435 [Candidatus Moraniibacteriota bacterium]
MKQKKVLRKITISMLAIFGLAFSVSIARAADVPPTQKKTVTVAMVDIYNAKIVSQAKNNFKLTFDLSNDANIQPDVKYAVRLIREDKGVQTVVDEQIYPEAFNLGENETIPTAIDYTAPVYLSGKLQLWIVARNQNGLMLSMVHPGDVILSGDGQYAEINAKSCFLKVVGDTSGNQYALAQGVDIKNEEKLIATCEIVNRSNATLTATPKAETHWRTTFGRVVSDNKELQKSLTLSSQEKKQISFILPKATIPQAYDVIVNLANVQGKVVSNEVVFHYVLRGASATIQNLRLDQDYYQKGDVAKASFFWTPSADSFAGSRFGATDGGKLFVTIFIKDKNNVNCVANDKKELNVEEKTPSFELPITADCLNPQISVAIQDAEGLILDQNDYNLISKSASGDAAINSEQKKENPKNNLLIYGIFFIAMLSIISFSIIFIKRKKGGGLVVLFLVAFGLLASNGARGHTFTDGFGKITFTVDLDKSDYSAGERIIATGSAFSSTCSNTVSMMALDVEINSVKYVLLSSTTYLQGGTGTSTASIGGSAQLIAGSYFAHFVGNSIVSSYTSDETTLDIPYAVVAKPKCNAFNFDSSNYVKDTWGKLTWTTADASDCLLSCTGLDPEFPGGYAAPNQYVDFGVMLNREGAVNCSLLPRNGTLVGDPCYASAAVGPAVTYSCTGTPPDPAELQLVCPNTKTSALANATLWHDVTMTGGCTGAAGACEYYAPIPTCDTFSFSSSSYPKDTWGPLSWTTTNAKSCKLSCTGLTTAISNLNVAANYTNFGIMLDETGTVNCSLTPYNGSIAGAPCTASASVCAATCIPVGPDMRACLNSFSATDIATYHIKDITSATTTCCASQRCYSCADGYAWNSAAGACEAVSCINPPDNADLCPGDAANETSNLVDICSSPAGGVPKCEYICSTGFHKSGSVCVADCVAGVCTTGCSDPCGVGICGTQPSVCAACPGNTCASVYCGPCSSGQWQEK